MPKLTTIRELIEKLSLMDQDLVVVTHDIEYGYFPIDTNLKKEKLPVSTGDFWNWKEKEEMECVVL